MINPDVAGAEYRHAIAISHGPPPVVGWRTAHHGIPSRHAVVDVYAMDDYVSDVLHRYACSLGNVNVHATPIQGFEAVHDKLLLV